MRSLLLLVCLLFLGAHATAQTPLEYPAVRMEPAPTIDGTVHDDEWGSATMMTEGFDENSGQVAPEKTTWWIGYDDQYIYFAARATDSEPKAIRANEYRTNVALDGEDRVGFWIDPFGQLQDENLFEINARGATNPRISGGRAAKREWLGEIFAKGRLTETGYEVEARVPWSVLRLPGKGVRNMRVMGFRILPRLGRSYLSCNIANGHQERIPVWKGVLVPEIKEPRSVKLLPYTYFGYDEDEGFLANAGLDFKTRLMGLDVVGSVNPDFRNIENQVLSLDFSYFERLADESRPFFLEGAEYFRTSGDAPLFVSQRIPSDFDFALKSFGKIGNNLTVAALDANDFTHQNDTVAVAEYAIDQRSNIRIAAANRATPTNNNLGTFLSYGRNMGTLSPFIQYMSTSDTEVGAGHRTNFGFGIEAGKLSGYSEYVEVSPNFLPRLGYSPEKDFRGVGTGLFYSDVFAKGPLRDYEIGLMGHHYDRFSGGGLYRDHAQVYAQGGLRNNVFVTMGASFDTFEGNHDSVASAYVQFPRNDPYRSAYVGVDHGRIAGIDYDSLVAGIRYRPTRPLQLNLSYQEVRHAQNDRLTQFSANYDINEFDSIGGRAVQRGGDLNFYVAYRRTGNRGNEYFLILGDPNALRFRPSIVLKAVFPIEWRF